MQWLGYTVTFGKDAKSKDFHFIRYDNWQTLNGLVLPQSLDWYTYENNLPLEKRYTLEFTDVIIADSAPDEKWFIMLKEAK